MVRRSLEKEWCVPTPRCKRMSQDSRADVPRGIVCQRIHYAKSNSHATILHNEGSEALYHTKLGVAEKKHGKLIVSSAQKDQMDAHAAASGKNKRGGGDSDDDEDEEMDSEQPKQKKLKVSADDDDEGAASELNADGVSSLLERHGLIPLALFFSTAAMEEESDDEDDVGPAPANGGAPKEVPHNILAVDNLPSEVTSDMLTVLFQQCATCCVLLF